MRWLRNQPWPGNIRQLRHTIERALLIGSQDTLAVEEFDLAMGMDAREEGRDSLPQVGAMTLDDMEKAMIVKAMKHYDGNISRVAEALGLSRAALYRRFEKFGIKP
jgi:transcriptional regulator of acetoin/glycerol metabolism